MIAYYRTLSFQGVSRTFSHFPEFQGLSIALEINFLIQALFKDLRTFTDPVDTFSIPLFDRTLAESDSDCQWPMLFLRAKRHKPSKSGSKTYLYLSKSGRDSFSRVSFNFCGSPSNEGGAGSTELYGFELHKDKSKKW